MLLRYYIDIVRKNESNTAQLTLKCRSQREINAFPDICVRVLILVINVYNQTWSLFIFTLHIPASNSDFIAELH